MALLVWFTLGIALWHFTVFLPDRFWRDRRRLPRRDRGALVFGAPARQIAQDKSLGDTDVGDRPGRGPGLSDRARDRLRDRRPGPALATQSTTATPERRDSASHAGVLVGSRPSWP